MGIHWLFNVFTTCITFPFLLFLVRWIGNTQISQATYFNWVAGACMGNIGANIISANTIPDILDSMFELLLFAGITILFSLIALKNRKFRSFTGGIPVILVNQGEIIYENLKKSKVNKDLLKQLLREQGYFDYKKIRCAVLEPTGVLSVLSQEGSSGDKLDPTIRNQSSKKRKKNQPIK